MKTSRTSQVASILVQRPAGAPVAQTAPTKAPAEPGNSTKAIDTFQRGKDRTDQSHEKSVLVVHHSDDPGFEALYQKYFSNATKTQDFSQPPGTRSPLLSLAAERFGISQDHADVLVASTNPTNPR